jgi:hypothetical protein
MRVASRWAPDRPQRGPYTGQGARTVGLLDDRPSEVPAPRLKKTMESARHRLRGEKLKHWYEPLDTARGKLRPEAKFGGAERGRTAASQFCRLLP